MAINAVTHGNQNFNSPFRCEPQFSNIPRSSSSVCSNVSTHLVIKPRFLRALKMILPWKMFIELQTPIWLLLLRVWAAEPSCSVTSYLQDTLSTSSTSQVTCHINVHGLCLKYANH